MRDYMYLYKMFEYEEKIPKDFDSLERSEIGADIIENLQDLLDF